MRGCPALAQPSAHDRSSFRQVSGLFYVSILGEIMCGISCGLKIAMITLFFAAHSIVLTQQSFADVQLTRDSNYSASLYIVGKISKSDADYIVQHENERGSVWVYLDSPGGEVDAALKIGQIIRKNEWSVTVPGNSKCFSSCALIYIAGVWRMNVGLIGLHRPYFSSAPLSRQAIEREVR
jgi:hypothetical protein